MTHDKPGSDNETIVDLSWPHGLSYPSVDHIVDHLKHLGPGAWKCKVDISMTFRHIRNRPWGLTFTWCEAWILLS